MNKKIKGTNLTLSSLFFGAIFLLAACEKPPVKPSSINTNGDVCFYCKSPIADVRFAAEFVTNDGFVRKFDDIGCLIANARRVGKKNIQAFFAMDVQSKVWLPAEQAHFVRSDKLRTPQKGGIIAFQDLATAQNFASRYQAELVKLEDLVK